MTMLPQPPPDAPAPPPSEAAFRSQLKLQWLWIVGLLSITGFLVLVAPLFIRSPRRATLTEAVSNARQSGLALLEFQDKYGKFPDATTIPAVQTATGNILPTGTKTSNDFFRQLFAAGTTQNEAIFYAEIRDTRKPDGLTAGVHFLEKGECGFTYFMGATKSDNPKRPLVVTPMIPGTDRFDPKPFKGKAVVMRIYGGVSLHPIDKKGHAILDGRNLMDPHHPIWDGHAPVIAWPDL